MDYGWRDTALFAFRERIDHFSIWDAFCATRDVLDREALFRHYMEFARTLAAKAFSGRMDSDLEFEDYLHFAYEGLIEAIDRFDPRRGVRFESFASCRIRGAILNGVTSLSERHSQIAARSRLLQERTESLRKDGSTPDGLAAIAAIADIAVGLAIGLLLEDSGMFVNELDDIGVPDNAYRSVEIKHTTALLQRLVRQLNPRERTVITMHYLHGTAFNVIADELKLSRGRISQLHKSGLESLKVAYLAQTQPRAIIA